MGTWGYKVGESDSALDNIERMWNDRDYLVSCLSPGFCIRDTEKMLLAVALIDASFNGYDERIWSIQREDDDYAYIKRIIDTPCIQGLCQAMCAIDMIKAYETDTWYDEETEKKRFELLNLIEIRLHKTWNDLIKYSIERR